MTGHRFSFPGAFVSLQLFHAVDHEELDRARGVGELQAELLFHGGFERPHVAGGPAQRNVVPVADSGFVDDGPVDDLTKRGDKTRDVSVGQLRRAVAESPDPPELAVSLCGASSKRVRT